MEKQFDLISFGEAMVRFSPLNNARLEQSSEFTLAIAAGELNVSVNTSRLGLKTAWVSKLVDTWSGKYVINKGREHGVDMPDPKVDGGKVMIPANTAANTNPAMIAAPIAPKG